MTVQDHITLQQALIATLSGKISTARALGDAHRLAELVTELTEAEETLTRLQAA